MNILQSERLRWLLSALVVVLLVSIVLRIWAEPQGGDAAELIRTDAPTIAVELAPTPLSATPTSAPRIAVDVIGAVQQPGVYEFAGVTRIKDVVQAAGGFTPDADRERINLAARIEDGQQVRVPHIGEAVPAEAAAAPDSEVARSGKVNINRADADALDALPGIGPTLAGAIIEYRTKNGPFTRIEELDNVKGIGPALLAKLTEQITVEP